RLVATLVVASRWLVRRLGRRFRRLALALPALGLRLGRRRDGGLGWRSGLGAGHRAGVLGSVAHRPEGPPVARLLGNRGAGGGRAFELAAVGHPVAGLPF